MTITIDNGVTITLTEEQLAEINRQQNKITRVEDINNYEDACKVLSIKPEASPSASNIIKTIVAAANFLDNNRNIWREDWDKHSKYKYYPVFERRAGGWVVSCLRYYYCFVAVAGFGSHFKQEKTCLLIVNKFLDLWLEYMHEGEVI